MPQRGATRPEKSKHSHTSRTKRWMAAGGAAMAARAAVATRAAMGTRASILPETENCRQPPHNRAELDKRELL